MSGEVPTSPKNSRSATPMTVNGPPESAIVLPTIDGSCAKRRRQ
jgi:hypothetical protein